MSYKTNNKHDRARGDASAHISRHPSGSRRPPRQERSRDTVEDILQAAAEVFGKLGYAGATTNKIAERAGVSIGSLYQYFDSKDDILRVLLERHQSDARAAIEAAHTRLIDPDIPLESGLRDLLDRLLALHTKDPALSHVLAHAFPHSERHRQDEEQEDIRYIESVQSILEQRTEVIVADTRVAANVVVQTVGLLMRWLGHEAPRNLNADAFVDELLKMLLSYLKGRPHRRRS
jgi:AcrR family transcriptional regulator